MDSLFIVSCTKESEKDFYNNTPLGKSIKKINLFDFDSTVTTRIYFENKEGLSKCYNNFLRDIYGRMSREVDNCSNRDIFTVFVHDDVYINDMFLLEKLDDGFNDSDILGIAGSNDFSLKRKPVCWHNCLRDNWSGGCFHPVKDKSSNINDIYYTDFGSFKKDVAVIDGVFIACDVFSLFQKKIFFDETFTFDFYDTDFCLSCIKNNLKIKTIPIILTHNSHGAGINNERYNILQDKFIQKWKVDK